MAFQFKNEDENGNSDFAEINIIPLVDVMLVLLIIFMVTAPLSIGGIKIELPYSKARGGSVDENRIVLTINKKGDFFFDKLEVNQRVLEERLRAIYENREKKDLYIRADREVAYGRVIDAMSAAKLSGVNKISMLTQAPGRG